MPLIEVEEAELNNYKEARGLLNKILGSAERKEFLKLYKKLHPDVPVPELDAAGPVEDKIFEIDKKHQEALDALRADIEQERMTRRTTESIESARLNLRKQGWMDDGIAQVEKLMTERGLTDYEAAAALVEKMTPRPEPVTPYAQYNGRDFGLTAVDTENEADQKLLMSRNPAERNNFVAKRVRETLDLVRSGKLVA